MNKPINYTVVDGKDAAYILDLMKPVIVGQPCDHVQIACLSIVVSMHIPNITPDQLMEGVKGVSEWIYTYADSLKNKGQSIN